MADYGGRGSTDKETNNQSQGRTGSGTPKKPGPAVGRGKGNATEGGGINRGTKKSKYQ